MKAIQLISKIRENFSNEIPLVNIFKYPTIRELASKIAGDTHIQQDQNLLLLNKSENTKNNIVFIHDGSGDINGYLALVSHIKKYNCWGIKSRTLHYLSPKNIDIETLAEEYIEEIENNGIPFDNLILAGWSLGGIIASEMARKLQSTPKSVQKVLLIDTVYENHEGGATVKFSFDKEKEILEKLNYWENHFANLNEMEDLWKVLGELLESDEQKFKQFKKSIPNDYKVYIPDFETLTALPLIKKLNTIRSLESVNFKIKEEKIHIPAVYFKASKTSFDTSGLNKVFSENIGVHYFDEDHFSLMKNEAAQKIAGLIEANKTAEPSRVFQRN